MFISGEIQVEVTRKSFKLIFCNFSVSRPLFQRKILEIKIYTEITAKHESKESVCVGAGEEEGVDLSASRRDGGCANGTGFRVGTCGARRWVSRLCVGGIGQM